VFESSDPVGDYSPERAERQRQLRACLLRTLAARFMIWASPLVIGLAGLTTLAILLGEPPRLGAFHFGVWTVLGVAMMVFGGGLRRSAREDWKRLASEPPATPTATHKIPWTHPSLTISKAGNAKITVSGTCALCGASPNRQMRVTSPTVAEKFSAVDLLGLLLGVIGALAASHEKKRKRRAVRRAKGIPENMERLHITYPLCRACSPSLWWIWLALPAMPLAAVAVWQIAVPLGAGEAAPVAAVLAAWLCFMFWVAGYWTHDERRTVNVQFVAEGIVVEAPECLDVRPG